MLVGIYIVLGLLIAGAELPRRVRHEQIDAMTVFNCYYFVLYVFVPLNVLYFGEGVVRQQYAFEQFGYGTDSTALRILGTYVLFWVGYTIDAARPHREINAVGGAIPLEESFLVAKWIFVIGLLTVLVYVSQIGGVREAIAAAAEVRSGEITIEGRYIFYRHFTQFASDAFVLCSAVLMGRKVCNMKITAMHRGFLLCTFVLFAFNGLTTYGRRSFIYPVIVCCLVYWSLGRRSLRLSVVLLILVFTLAGVGTVLATVGPIEDPVTLLRLAYEDPEVLTVAYDGATQGLADSFIHYVAAEHAALWQFGFLTDIVNAPRDFVPSRLLGFVRTRNMLDETSEFILGHSLPDDRTGEEPLGLHGYLLVNFGRYGMFAAFFCLGLAYKWIHTRFMPTEQKDSVGWLVYWWVVLGFFAYFREGMLIFVLKGQLTWWLTIAVLLRYRTRSITLRQAPISPSVA